MGLSIFVYGTLRKGERNHHYLETSKFFGTAKTTHPYKIIQRYAQDYPEGYPVAIPCSSAEILAGEVYEITDETLKQLDILEDYPNEYDRFTEEFTLDNGTKISACIYIGKDDTP